MTSAAPEDAASSRGSSSCPNRASKLLLEQGFICQRHLKHCLLAGTLGSYVNRGRSMLDHFIILHYEKKIMRSSPAQAILRSKNYSH